MTDDLTPPHWGLPESFKEECHKCGKRYWPQPDDVIEIGTDEKTGRRFRVGAICKECTSK